MKTEERLKGVLQGESRKRDEESENWEVRVEEGMDGA